MKRTVLIFALVTCIFAFTSCATVFSGSNSDVIFESNPEGADVILNGINYGTTPASISLQKNKQYNLEIKKDGYKSAHSIITKSVNPGWVITDVIFGGVVGVIIDAATGSWNNLNTDAINVNLEPINN